MSEVTTERPVLNELHRGGKVYFFGTSDGKTVKIGFTTKSLAERKQEILRGQLSNVNLHLLVAVRGTRTQENELKRECFEHLKDGYNSTESFNAETELVEYINWLRQQWWVYLDENDHTDETPAWPSWMPTSERRMPYPKEDPYDLIPRHVSYTGPLAGTKWDKLSTPGQVGEDFYTPKEIVDAARMAMGGIDLDPASHWQANRIHRVPVYYHLHRLAADNPWFGRVWLNPPYGDNAPWFDRIIEFWDKGEITQLCMLSPVWVFTTQIAKPIIQRSSAMTLLTPTPTFWGHPRGHTGINHPHAIIYLGKRVAEFQEAFRDYGIPFQLL